MQKFSTLDIYQAGFFALNGIEPDVEIQNGKAIFVFPNNDGTYDAMRRFNNDEKVPVATFSTWVKRLRAAMLSKKGNEKIENGLVGKKGETENVEVLSKTRARS